jgi:hypothetical protein
MTGQIFAIFNAGGRKDMKFSRLARFTALLLIPFLASNNLAFAAKKPADPAAMKAKIVARGVGQGVRITLGDNVDVKGLIVSIGEQSFAVKPKGAEPPREIQYAQVTGIHNQKLSTGSKIIIAAVILAAAIGITAAVGVHEWDTHPI